MCVSLPQTGEAASYHLLVVSAMQRADKKLTFIPMVYILLRMWGTIQFIYAISVSKLTYFGCVPEGYAVGFTFLAYMQVS